MPSLCASSRERMHAECGAINRLYRGMVPPLLGVTPIFAVSFWVSS